MDVVVMEHAGRTFDWAPRFDPLSLNFRAAPGVTAMPTSGRVWATGPVLDQGSEGACVGMGCSGAVAAAPSSRAGVNLPYALNWYRRAQRLDQWPGEAYPGTSVLAGCLVGRERKLWAGFRWSKTPAELAAGVLKDELGPAIIGVQWSADLYDTAPSGLLPADVTLDPNLGHCVLVFGYLPAWNSRGNLGAAGELQVQVERLGLVPAWRAADSPVFLILNSWGKTWGVNGMAVAPLALVRRWFASHGEFALPEQRTKGPRTMAEPDDTEQPEQESADTTLHLTAAQVMTGDRVLDPPEELGQESATVVGNPVHSSGYGGRRVTISTTAGSFQLGAGEPVTVRRPQ